MKTMISVIALALFSSSSFAADAASCKAKLTGVAGKYSAYLAKQSPACVAEMNKPGSERSTLVIIGQCKSALAELQPIKDQSSAACAECKGVSPKLAVACNDSGVTNFINAVKAL